MIHLPRTISRNAISIKKVVSGEPSFSSKQTRIDRTLAIYLGAIALVCMLGLKGNAQEKNAKENGAQASVNTSIGPNGSGSIVVEARGELPKPPLFYTAIAKATANVGREVIQQVIALEVNVLQGDAETFSFGIHGDDRVTAVTGNNLKSWSVRQTGDMRFLDLQVANQATKLNVSISLRSPGIKLPATLQVTHLTPGRAVGFDSTLAIQYAPGVQGVTKRAAGFSPLDTDSRESQFQSSTGGQLEISLTRSGSIAAPIELVDTELTGMVDSDGKSVDFQLRGTAIVTEDNTTIEILSGKAAASQVPSVRDYRLRLSGDGSPVYEIFFPRSGTYPITLDFVAALQRTEANEQSMDFTVATGAVVPLTINGLDGELDFHRDQQSVVPVREREAWVGFLPATGRVKLQWKQAREAGEGKLFFTTSGRVEARLGAGLLRQDHRIKYQVLQGELDALSILLQGPGEILDVQGSNLVAWKVASRGDDRQLDITLSQPITGESEITVRSQTPLDAFPIRVEGLRLNPVGAIRHSGFLRLSNIGSVRLEPTGLRGLTQLAPEQFPGDKIEARQIFVYRFPAADHDFTIAANRIEPEVNVSQIVLYQVAEADRVIKADIELDIREAPIRDLEISIPDDYSVVSVSGASVTDYITASESNNGRRELKVMFGQDVLGRQVVILHLEKSQPAAAESWQLPRIEFPDAKAVRGDIGIVGEAGFRMAIDQTDLLVEKPLSYFPKSVAGLQHAFRIRETDWSANVQIELLQRTIQSDVFHLYSLSQETVYGSALINFFVTGAPVAQWRVNVPASLGNVMVDGQDVRTWRREGDVLIVSLHQPVMGAYTLLVTSEEKPDANDGNFQVGQIAPLDVQGERGYVQVVSPMQVELNTVSISNDVLQLDPLELPAEFRLLSAAPPLGTWQYTDRPFDLQLNVKWFQQGTTVTQVVEFAEANSRVSQDGELVTDVIYYVKSRGRRTLRIQLPEAPVRLWEVSVDDVVVTARQADDATLIPLPGGTDPNVPIEVRLRLGKPAVRQSNPELNLPIVFAPVLKTQWSVVGDEKHLLIPNGGTVKPSVPVTRPSGFYWVAKRGLTSLFLISVLTIFGIATRKRSTRLRPFALIALTAAILLCGSTANIALSEVGSPEPLRLSLPILSAGEPVQLWVKNTPLWRVDLSWFGLFFCVAGLAVIIHSVRKDDALLRAALRCGAALLIALGILMQGAGAPWFYAVLAVVIFVLLLIGTARTCLDDFRDWKRRVIRERRERRQAADSSETGGESGGFGTASTTLGALVISTLCCSTSVFAAGGFTPADSIQQDWQITNTDSRLKASASITLSGKPGDQYLLLQSPAVLTKFEADGLRLTKSQIPGGGLGYIITIPATSEDSTSEDSTRTTDPEASHDPEASESVQYEAAIEYQVEAIQPLAGMPVLTGVAGVHTIGLTYDEAGWEVICPAAVRVESGDEENATIAKLLLGPTKANVLLKPKARDVTLEETRFFVEASNLYLPGPGVIDGRHHVNIRTSQGEVRELSLIVPSGLTVSQVTGPVGSWQFDADSGRLKLEIEPAQSSSFNIMISTQRGLDPLPVDVNLAPLRVVDADGQVGLVAIAFGADAQPEKLESQQMSVVNLRDFDASLLPDDQTVLHRVYRYGANGGDLDLRVAPVEAEVRVMSKQVLSLGDERVVLGVNFSVEIARAGLFQLSFPLPDGLEIESLTGAALHHWSELSEGEQRQIILHLNGKTIGSQTFSMTLSGNAPSDVADWQIPRFEINEAARQTGELVVRPATGIRLQTVSRENVSETDPRSLGGEGQGALAFRLLQGDWKLVLGIEKLEPWITGQVLHEMNLREGQTRSALFANFQVQNASIRELQIALPITNEDEVKTLRANGEIVSDLIRSAPDSNIWNLLLKRRVVGNLQFQIEYERRDDRESEAIRPAGFPQARQLSYYFAIRAGGRLELEADALTAGWQRAEWNAVPQALRDLGNRIVPTLTLRAVAPEDALNISIKRHSLADTLKLRVAEGTLTTVLSPSGNQLTAVDLSMEVIQRSSLKVGLPADGELFNVFVNGESVNSIRMGDRQNTWQFYILPGIDDRTASVRFVYSVPGRRLSGLELGSPQLNVPLENIQWSVIAPEGFELVDEDGNLELVKRENREEEYDRVSYLSKASAKRSSQAQQAEELLEQANQLLQAGEQTKARWAFNSVANQYALDAASNEDARVQLENLQTQQAIVGLNARRQRLYLDNKLVDSELAQNQQLIEAAAVNPILQQDDLNYRPQQLGELLRGNTTEDNAILQRIAGRLVQHQHTTEPAPQAIIISLPEEGSVYTFGRSVQVAEDAPLELDLDFDRILRLHFSQVIAVLFLLTLLAASLAFVATTSGLRE